MPTSTSELDLRSAAAQLTGLAMDRFQTVQLELETLTRQGLLVDLEISGVTMFTKLASYDELGISEAEDVLRSRINRPTRNLIPEGQIKALRSVEASMRQMLVDVSRDVAGFRPYRWVPFTRYEDFRSRWSALVNRFEEIKAEILASLDFYRDDLAADFTRIAINAWRSIRAKDAFPVLSDALGRRAILTQDEFVDSVLDKVMSRFPTRSEVEKGLKADYRPLLVYGAEQIERDRARAALVRAQSALEQADLQAQTDEAFFRSQAAAHDAQLAAQMNDARLQAMFSAEAEHARAQLASMASPFEELFTQLRADMANAAVEMAASIKGGQRIHPKVAERGRRLVEVFDLMATHDDRVLRGKLLQLKELMARSEAAGAHSVDEALDALSEIRGLVETAKEDFTAGSVSRFAFLE